MTNLEKYEIIFGFADLIPVPWFSDKRYKDTEEVYAECIKKGVTWRELTGWNKDKDERILL